MQFEQAFDPFRSIQASWKLLKKAPLTVLIGGLLLSFLDSGSGGYSNTVNWNARGGDQDLEAIWDQVRPMLLIMIPMMVCIGLVMFLFSCWLQVGFARGVKIGLRTGKDEVGTVFDGSGRFVQMVTARFLAAVMCVVGILPIAGAALALWLVHRQQDVDEGILVLLFGLAVLVWLPLYLYLLLGLVLVAPVVACEAISPTAGIARSWRLASGNRLRLLWFWIVLTVFSGIGCCACCIGALITMPMGQVMRFEAYLALMAGDEHSQWWIASGRPAPDGLEPGLMSAGAPDPNAWGSPPPPPSAPPAPNPPPAPPRF